LATNHFRWLKGKNQRFEKLLSPRPQGIDVAGNSVHVTVIPALWLHADVEWAGVFMILTGFPATSIL
jgi:hypothetical protein